MASQGHRVLIITNELNRGETVARYLHHNGYGVSTAPDAGIAIEKFAADPADIVIVDQLRGATRTLAAMRQLRSLNDLGAQVPVILADSPEWDDTMVSAAQSIGVSQFIYDPFEDLHMLLDLVQDTLSTTTAHHPGGVPATYGQAPATSLGEYVHLPTSTAPRTATLPLQQSSPETDSGALDDCSIAEVLARYFTKEATGKLALRRDELDKAIFFSKGSPVFVESCIPSETLGAFLQKQGRLTSEQQKIAEAQQCEEGKLQGQILLEKGWISPNELFQFLTEHQAEKIISCFEWDRGFYEFFPGQTLGSGNVPMNLDFPRLLLDGIRRHYKFQKLYSILHVSDDTELVGQQDGPTNIEELKLEPAEARIFDLARRRVTVGEVLNLSTGDLTAVLQTLYGFRLLKILRFEGGKEEMGLGRTVSASSAPPTPGPRRSTVPASSSPSPAKPAPVSQRPSPVSQRPSSAPRRPSSVARRSASCRREGASDSVSGAVDELSIDVTNMAVLERLIVADHFTLLGIERDAPLPVIRRALQGRMNLFHPDRLVKEPIGVQTKGAHVFKRLLQSYETLSDDAKRREYVEELEAMDGLRASSIPIGPSPATERRTPTNDVLRGKAKHLFEKAREAMEIDRFKLAITRLERANQDQQGNMRVLCWLGWAYYNAYPDERDQAEYYVVEARRAEPTHPDPYLFMARIRAMDGAQEQALEFYQKAVELDPSDLDIAREVHRFKEKIKNTPKRGRRAAAKRSSENAHPRKGGDPSESILDADVGSLFKKFFKK